MLVGISGKIKSGKDTVRDMIIRYIQDSNQDKQVYISTYAFADNLKKIAAAITGCDHFDLNLQEFKELIIPRFKKITEHGMIVNILSTPIYSDSSIIYESVTYREALQFFGNKFRRDFGENFWINLLNTDLLDTTSFLKNELQIISDVRYENEAKFIKDSGGILIRVNRPNIQTFKSIESHSSEISLDTYPNFDYIIENNGTLDELYEKVKLITKVLLNKI